jgi:hypothetical protein
MRAVYLLDCVHDAGVAGAELRLGCSDAEDVIVSFRTESKVW